MRALINGSQFGHVAPNGRLVQHFHIVKVVQGHAPTCGVGIVGVYNQLVMCRLVELVRG